jgi:hypothetical protein
MAAGREPIEGEVVVDKVSLKGVILGGITMSSQQTF